MKIEIMIKNHANLMFMSMVIGFGLSAGVSGFLGIYGIINYLVNLLGI